jgi:hypothetical protein
MEEVDCGLQIKKQTPLERAGLRTPLPIRNEHFFFIPTTNGRAFYGVNVKKNF